MKLPSGKATATFGLAIFLLVIHSRLSALGADAEQAQYLKAIIHAVSMGLLSSLVYWLYAYSWEEFKASRKTGSRRDKR